MEPEQQKEGPVEQKASQQQENEEMKVEPDIVKKVKIDYPQEEQTNLAKIDEFIRESELSNGKPQQSDIIEVGSNDNPDVILQEGDEKKDPSNLNQDKSNILKKPFKLKEKKRGRKSQQEILSLKYKKQHHSNKCSSCKKNGTVLGCHRCPKAYHLECLNFKEEDIPKKFLCDKCKEKSKKQRQRDREKTKKKRIKENEKEKIKQLKLDNLILDPTKKMGRPKKEKNKDEHIKRFDEFAQKYSQYIDGKIVKFPIEDILIVMYDDLFPDIQITQKKPESKISPLIPSQYMGQIIPLWNFLQTFSTHLGSEDFLMTSEEIFLAVDYQGEELLDFICNLHQSLLDFVYKDLCDKNKIDNQKDLYDKPFFALTKYLFDIKALDNIKPYLWTEFARNLRFVPYLYELFEDQQPIVDKFEELALSGLKGYNQLNTNTKLIIINTLISCVDESDSFHDVISTKTDKLLEMSKEKNDLQGEIKKDESELLSLESNIKQIEENLKNKQIRLDLPRAEQLKMYREADKERKEINKNKSQIGKLKVQIEKKKNRYEELQHILPFFLNTAMFLGMDVNKSEFWFFYHDPNRIYSYYKQNMVDDDNISWVYWDTKEDIDNLIKSLNPKGIRERNLQKNIRQLLDTNHLFFEENKLKGNQLSVQVQQQQAIESKKNIEKESILIVDNSDSNEKEVKSEEIIINQEINNNKNNNTEEKNSTTKNSPEKSKVQQIDLISEEEFKINNPQDPENNQKQQESNKMEVENVTKDDSNKDIKDKQQNLENTKQAESVVVPVEVIDPKVKIEMEKERIMLKLLNKMDKLSELTGYQTMTRLRNAHIQRQNNNREKIFTVQNIIDMLLNCEEQFTYYLQRRKCRWLTSEKREEFKKNLGASLEVHQIQEYVMQMNEGFSHVDYLYFEESYNNLPEEKKKKYFKEIHSDSDVDDEDDEFYFGAQAQRDSSHSNHTNNAFLELERNPKILIKKLPIRIWGVYNEKMRKHWMSLEVDNISNLHFLVYIFCTIVERYVDRKMDQYNKNDNQYYPTKEEKNQSNNNNFYVPQKKEKKLFTLSELDQYRFNSSNQTEQQRENQEKLNELLNLRRSDRTKDNKRRQIYTNLNEQQWDDQCKKCGEFGDVICCESCPSVFHPECIGLKQIPEGRWNCYDCLERMTAQIQSTRQTRSSAKKFGI